MLKFLEMKILGFNLNSGRYTTCPLSGWGQCKVAH